jgi:ribosomal protein S18 acetylase RimI-like enzyme
MLGRMIIEGLADSDLEALLTIQHAWAGEAAPWTAEVLRRTIHDPARGGGAQVRVARDEGVVIGAIAWVLGDDICYLSPLLASNERAARALAEIGLREAGAAARIRVTTGARDSHVARVLQELGFEYHSEFLELSRAPGELAAPDIAPLGWCSLAEADPVRLLALHNETFREVPNTLPLELADLEQLVRGAFAEASSVIADGERYVGHLIALRYDDTLEPYAEIDVVGVLDDYRRRGLGRALLARALGAAHREGLREMRALVSSLNAGSLELHRNNGFSVRYRRFQWQLTR